MHRIRQLLYEDGFTINGARIRLAEENLQQKELEKQLKKTESAASPTKETSLVDAANLSASTMVTADGLLRKLRINFFNKSNSTSTRENTKESNLESLNKAQDALSNCRKEIKNSISYLAAIINNHKGS